MFKSSITTSKLSSAITLKGKLELFLQLFILNLRLPTGRFRTLPDFLIIGAQKCGTTSLYKYLIQHPDIHRPWFKEIHFFDRYIHKNINWYKSHFPLKITKSIHQLFYKKYLQSFEASPDYLFYPGTAFRTFNILPTIKLIVLLRNPVDRAISHYHHEFIRGRESRSFDEAVNDEIKKLYGFTSERSFYANKYDFNYDHFSYLKKGIYYVQLNDWLKFFNRDRFLILESSTFYDDPVNCCNLIFDFLNLRPYKVSTGRKYNVGGYRNLKYIDRDKLLSYYAQHNEKLYKIINTNYSWDI